MGILLRLTGYALRYRRSLALAYVSLIGSTLLSLAIPRFLGIAIDSALEGSQTGDLVMWAALVLAVTLVRGGFGYGQSYFSEHVSQGVSFDLRHAFLLRLQSLSFGFHDRERTGDMMSRATADVESIRWFVSFGLIYSVHVLVLLGAVAGLLLTTNWQLGLLGLSAVPLATAIAVRVSRRFRVMWTEVQADTGRMTTVLQESLSGMRVVKTFGAEEHEKAKFYQAAEVVAERTFAVNRLHAANSSLLTLLFTLVTAGVVWYGGWLIIDGRAAMTAGELTQFVLYLGLLVMPTRMSGWIVNNFARAISAGERIFQVLDARSPVEERSGAVDLGRAAGAVTFDSVDFSYGSGHNGATPAPDVLRGVSLEVAAGQKVAILGPPGGGKSSLVGLIPRFYDVTGGAVTVDGVDVRDVTLQSLRRNVGIVFQDVFLFMASVRDNIAYGSENASLEQVMAAARTAQVHDFIMGLPQQYDTLVGERGVTLSGGQKQRVAIARTLLLDPPVLILDDSTSSVDSETETAIQRALDQVMEGRTTFIIAHRVSSLRRADQILVMDGGRVVERGAHRELVAMEDGAYREIYRLQLEAESDALVETPGRDEDPG